MLSGRDCRILSVQHGPSPPPTREFLKALRALEEAVECQRQGRPAEAERLFTRLLKKNPDYFDGLHFFGLFRYHQGELNEALKLLTKAIKVHPRSAERPQQSRRHPRWLETLARWSSRL